MMLNDDYKDMLRALADEGVDFMLVGAYAIGAHGYPRATGDIDIWVSPTPANAKAVLRALLAFGALLAGVTAQDFENDDTILQIGVAPSRIDIITGVTGLTFDPVFERSVSFHFDDITVRIPTVEDLIANKRATGRAKDLADVEALENLKG